MSRKPCDSLIPIFKACFDAAGQHPDNSPVITRHGRLLLEAMDFWLRTDGSLTIRIDPGRVQFNHQVETKPQLKDQAFAWFEDCCRSRHIFEILILRDTSVEDLIQLIALFHRDAYLFANHADAPHWLAEAGVHRIQINPPSVEDSFTVQVPFSMGRGYFPDQDREADFHLPEQTATPAKKAGLVENLFISRDDFDTLRTTMTHLIAQGHMTRVADALTLMRNDLRSLDRDDRELAFSSYQVVVRILVETEQTKALYRIVKAMPFDLRICQEYDLYRIHLVTFTSILQHFVDKSKYRPFLYGLTVLAEQSLRHRDPFKSLLEDHLKSFLTPHLLESMVTKAERDPDLRKRMHILFREHALGIFNTLLTVLFETKERRLRKVILETLHNMGTVIFPDVLNELDQAISENKPWYVKRNLLLLLSPKPPTELVPRLLHLDQHETGKRVLRLVHKCLFRIEDPRAFDRGYDLINRNLDKKEPLLELLPLVGEGGLAEYGPLLIGIAENHDDASIRLAAIATLGHIETRVAQDYLKSILAKTSFFKKRSSSKRRVAAVKALAIHPQHLTYLATFIQDKDEQVRQACHQALSSEN
ncbi:HEAT repeat domain-containing protein [Acanthopleuribacter pedis]|uniref:HEAT repeat domain-containing protein n=1 Tax=Acanthopleuribacter pedis TaxID=442870 RepID=A0A8J7Q575_9BACT|nr:HEAT repeat domain-containing protein [Acanthopleuribacter pedis]MBO1316849.1 HEAT repeat domain-containing protein [Acanthopleuribacter pedis]